MSTVYVLVEHTGSGLAATTAELITAARPLGEVAAVVVGAPGVTQTLAPALAEAGAATVVAAESADVAGRLILPQVDALAALAAANPGPVLIAAGASGNEIAGRLAARLASGVLCDVVGINADRTAAQSVFGDQVQVSAAVGGASPIYTLRPGAVEAAPAPAPAAGTVMALELPAATAKDVAVTGFAPAERGSRPDLTQAKVVVAAGRGVGSKEGMELVERLADSLGAAVGVTRDAVDLEYYDGTYQIGQTGVTVSPDLYIGLGISGAIQHTSGMQTAKKIVVVNNDEDAPIFQIADLGVVGDLFDVVPALIDEIDQRG
ncbi:electron transfer flavoprotein subunit alpha/FixB family protein [Corynebacterium marinum]|uniref:Electron transfer flavoprotein alpha subunit n=1 Tax=Corynebacterium marinum DSM 44953 TaxID=1224162 RepID=A0A0B6TL04_9CORY|nr:electron transfer flavoprotein subunit alpha/FixB family protein [Corynebacterium marinum]AJK68648.1 electron transfer flavoprotein alpha subunit [Corynebacterium marinum DSM 44953]GGO14175.1 electron transfer flavoprotein subunit alpha [Corynebacterium marinum]